VPLDTEQLLIDLGHHAAYSTTHMGKLLNKILWKVILISLGKPTSFAIKAKYPYKFHKFFLIDTKCMRFPCTMQGATRQTL
jgi:hypothetical protein